MHSREDKSGLDLRHPRNLSYSLGLRMSQRNPSPVSLGFCLVCFPCTLMEKLGPDLMLKATGRILGSTLL